MRTDEVGRAPGAPQIPDEIQASDLDKEVRAELLTLAKPIADTVARHLVAAGQLIDEDTELALSHAMAARRLASRIAAVREAVGLAAYAAGEWQTALSEIRTYHRMTGRQNHVAVIADCERALGRPERAIDLFRTAERDKLGREDAIELLIVAAGARTDLGQHDAAVAMLQVRELTSGTDEWAARLRYAYADSLLAAGRPEEARAWFAKAAEVDEDSVTDAAERLLELDGVQLEDDDLDDEDDEQGDEQGDDEARAVAGDDDDLDDDAAEDDEQGDDEARAVAGDDDDLDEVEDDDRDDEESAGGSRSFGADPDDDTGDDSGYGAEETRASAGFDVKGDPDGDDLGAEGDLTDEDDLDDEDDREDEGDLVVAGDLEDDADLGGANALEDDADLGGAGERGTAAPLAGDDDKDLAAEQELIAVEGGDAAPRGVTADDRELAEADLADAGEDTPGDAVDGGTGRA